MSYDIIVRFPNRRMADEWCGQMSDGWGDGFCDFSFWRQKEGTEAKQRLTEEDFEDNVVEQPAKPLPVYFVNSIEQF